MALPVTVSDILKILDQVPLWRAVAALPKQISALEDRVRELESLQQVPKIEPGETCPACGARAMRRSSSTAMDGDLGEYGGRTEVWTCGDCSAEDRRAILPGRR